MSSFVTLQLSHRCHLAGLNEAGLTAAYEVREMSFNYRCDAFVTGRKRMRRLFHNKWA